MMDKPAFAEAYGRIVPAFAFREQGGVGIYTLPAFSAYAEIDHGFSARIGGVSQAPFTGLNLSFTNDRREDVLENYRRFAQGAGFPDASMVMDSYEHGITVRRVDRQDRGRGYTRESLPPCDGLITNDPEVTLITGHADCMAFYFFDPVKKAIGLCHAGWRGALGRIGGNVIAQMKRVYGSDPKDMLCGVGPSICPKCFEVGEDVCQSFEAAFPLCPLRGINERGNPTVDLWQVAACQFMEQGVLPENIHLMGVCTKETMNLYSYRREGRTGGMAAFLRLK